MFQLFTRSGTNTNMTEVVCFNVGGRQYNLPDSFLKGHSQTLLGRTASKQHAGSEKEVFLDQNGEYFQFVLSYLRDDGHVLLPTTVSKSLFLDELEYFEIHDVDKSKIVYDYHVVSTQSHVLMVDEIRSEIDSWDAGHAIICLSKKCATIYMTTGGKLNFDICGPKIIPSFKKDNFRCSRLIWMELLSLVNNEEMKLLPHDEEKCNKYLWKIGLKIICVVASTRKSTIKVVMSRT
jgi:BTB/POZ domain